MNRLFGASSSKKPKPSLQDAIAAVRATPLFISVHFELTWFHQTDARVGTIEVKIKKLDGELGRYKEQMSKLRNGPGKVRSSSVLQVLYHSRNNLCA